MVSFVFFYHLILDSHFSFSTCHHHQLSSFKSIFIVNELFPLNFQVKITALENHSIGLDLGLY